MSKPEKVTEQWLRDHPDITYNGLEMFGDTPVRNWLYNHQGGAEWLRISREESEGGVLVTICDKACEDGVNVFVDPTPHELATLIAAMNRQYQHQSSKSISGAIVLVHQAAKQGQ